MLFYNTLAPGESLNLFEVLLTESNKLESIVIYSPLKFICCHERPECKLVLGDFLFLITNFCTEILL